MSTDFSRLYMPPGVYIEESESVVVSSTGVPPTLVALVGQTRGHMVHTEQLLFGNTPAVLSKKGVSVDTVQVVTVSTRLTVVDTDYTATAGSAGVGGALDYTTSLVATANNSLPDNTAVFVTYEYVPVDYFQPKLVESFEDVKDLYGEPLNLEIGSANDPAYQYVLSPLSLAAKVAFENGATSLVLCAAEAPSGGSESALSTSRRTKLAAALARTSTYSAINVIVAVATGIASADASGAVTDLGTHVTNASLDDMFRFGVIGFDSAVTLAPDTMLSTSGVQNRRVMLAYAGPGAVLMYSGGINSTFTASHAYLAAAYAGKMAALPVQRSLTKQSVSSFSGLGGTPLSNSLKNQYSQSGVAVAEVNRVGRLVVRHGVTTDMTNINTREASVVRARDALVTMVANGFAESDLVGQPVDQDLLYTVKSVMQGYLETAVDTDTIVSYSGLAVRQRPADLSVVEIKFAYKPAYPLNYIAISFSIDMTSGSVGETTEAA